MSKRGSENFDLYVSNVLRVFSADSRDVESHLCRNLQAGAKLQPAPVQETESLAPTYEYYRRRLSVQPR